jgi:DnaK suppressor protein
MKKKPAKKASSGARKPAKAAAKPKISGAKLDPIRRRLLEMREDLVKTVNKQQVSDTSGDIGDAADQASQSIEKEIMFELSDVERTTLDQIEAALRKIDKGSYGLCESCQKPIAKPRLDALPFARYCITCQSSSEKAPELAETAPDFRAIGEAQES